ncbi:hypothetical protein KBB27_00270 [Patescibacteria group bacterium]|nr:hypothetical protein [Patescibacteria group bacterium]
MYFSQLKQILFVGIFVCFALSPLAIQAASPGLYKKVNVSSWYQTEKGVVLWLNAVYKDVYKELKKQATPIANKDLLQIPIGLLTDQLVEKDTDKDGLDDEYERAFGTNSKLRDTDKDGYDDRSEILSGYDPLKKKVKMMLNAAIYRKQRGKFVWNGTKNALWFITPDRTKRYFISPVEGKGTYTLNALAVSTDVLPVTQMPAVSTQAPISRPGDFRGSMPSTSTVPSPAQVITPSPTTFPEQETSTPGPSRPITAPLTVSPTQCGDRIREGSEQCDGEWYCDARCGLSQIATIQPSHPIRPCLPETETGGLFQMGIGSSCTYQVNGKSYTISLPSISPNYRYPKFVITDGTNTFDTGYTQTGFYSVENDFSLGRYRFTEITPSGIYTVIIHKIIPTSQIVVRGNCDRIIGDPDAQDRCRAFMQYQQTVVLPALDRISGGSMGRCYKDIQIVAVSDASPYQGEADSLAESGVVNFKINQMRTILNLTPMMEDHEMIHLMDFCLNIPNSEESRHSFFWAKLLELNRATGNNAQADRLLAPVQYAASVDSSDPAGTNDFYGCTGIKTKLLSQAYLNDRSVFSRYFTELVINANKLMNNGEMGDKDEILYNQIVARVTHADQTAIAQINNMCPRSPIGGNE